MRPAKLSAKVFLEVPPILAHYVETERNTWLESNPSRGAITLLNRSGAFFDLEALAVERRHELACLGLARFRALRYRIGFEQGRRDGHRHLSVFNDNARVALQASLIFGQLQGRFVSECIRFEFDLEHPGPKRRGIWLDYVEGTARALMDRGIPVVGCDLLLDSNVPHGARVIGDATVATINTLSPKRDAHPGA